ncbi:MAG: hypothetical protein GX850_07005 [Clostridiaceae bacterium]|jgi:hypothetical protein|nr:hypothetical protein [Clostridiaceae bacterium]
MNIQHNLQYEYEKLTVLLFALMFVLMAVPVFATPPTQNIVEIASSESDFSIFVEGVVAAS